MTGFVDSYFYKAMKKNNILVYDRDNVSLLGLISILNEMPEVNNAKGCFSSDEFRTALAEQSYDLYIVNIEGVDRESVDLIENTYALYSQSRILVDSVCSEELLWEIVQGMHIRGVLHKNTEVREVENAVRTLLTDNYYCSPDYERFSIVFPKQPVKKMFLQAMLTTREREVLVGIAHGYSSALIAQELNITENTVECFRKKLFQKLNARNAVDLVMKALKEDWINLNEVYEEKKNCARAL